MRSYVILLNWNGWKDTIECLESVLRLSCDDFCAVVCDNASTDGSWKKITAWANGEVLDQPSNPQLSRLSSPSFPKPVPYLKLTREQAESGCATYGSRLVLIQTGSNLGFAGGNNVGLRYALGDPAGQFFWLLNNDTVVEPDALSAMMRRMDQQPEIGLCGSLILSYDNPAKVEAEGGMTYCRWTSRVRLPASRKVEELSFYPAKMDYVHGASMLASRVFLEKIGLMEESYFLYYEELDWAMRAKGKFKLGYARDSVVYHKEGAAIGSNRDRKKRSLLSEKYLSRNRVLFTKRYIPWALPSVVVSVCLAAAHRFCRGDVKRARAMLSFMLQGLIKHIPRTSHVMCVHN